MKSIRTLAIACLTSFMSMVLIAPSPSEASVCTGPTEAILAPIAKMNVSNFFPWTVAGATVFQYGPARNCPTVSKQPICICPGRLGGLPTPGPILTFHMPQYVAEITGNAGCSPLFGGVNLLGNSFSAQDSSGRDTTGLTMKRQIHWFEYPVFSVLEMFKDAVCFQYSSSIDIAYMTEFDPLWNNSQWGAIFNPEGALFTTLPIAAACAADAIATTFTRCSIDPLIWCNGPGHIYPWTAIQKTGDDGEMANVKILNRFMHRQTRVGALWRTVGPDAVCNPVISPVMVPSQYRLDLIYPYATTTGKPLVMGTNTAMWGSIGNTPFKEHTVFLIWNAQQCCLNL